MNGVEVRVYNQALELQGVIDEFSSLIWIRRYQTPGEFELHTPYSPETKRLLIPENIVQKFDGLAVIDAGIIEAITITSDEIIVKGRFLESYLDRRIIRSVIYKDNVVAETTMRQLISQGIGLPHMENGTLYGWTDQVTFQATYKTILNIFMRICRATGLGFRVRPDFENHKMYMEVLKGVDRVDSAAEKVIFSEDFDNLFDEVYSYDSTNERTRVCALQQLNENNPYRYSVVVGAHTSEGYACKDLYLLTSIEKEDWTTFDELTALMTAQAEKALKDRVIAESFTFSTDTEAPFRYRIDYDLGDIVRVKHNAWGIDLTRRITEIEEDYEENGSRHVVITCGDPLPETIDMEED